MLSLCGKRIGQAEKVEASPRNGFRSEAIKPLTEGIRKSRFGWLKKTIAGAMLGVTLATGAMAGLAGCNGETTRTAPYMLSDVKVTGEDGKTVFEASGKKFVDCLLWA